MAEQNSGDARVGTNQEERTPLEIHLEENIPFSALAETMYLTSNDLCLLTNELFKSVFADCEGSTFEAGNGNDPFISIAFNHGEYGNDATLGVERAGASKGPDIVSRIRYRDNFVANGDRYHLTEDGKDVFKPLLNFRAYNNGNPNWKNIVTEFQEGQMMYGQQPQYTKVLYLDPAKICKLIFGETLGGDNIDYNVVIRGSMNMAQNPYVVNNNYMLQITRVSEKEIKGIYEKLGFGSFSSIVR